MDEGFKKCLYCLDCKPRAEFHRNRGKRDGLGDRCKSCARERSLLIRNENRALVQSLKEAPCVDCGKKYPHYIMEFDHVRGVKKCNVADLVSGARATLLTEIAKCDVLCGNCHNARTYFRRIASGEEE